MLRKLVFNALTGVMVTGIVSVLLLLNGCDSGSSGRTHKTVFNEPYICAMHPQSAHEGAGQCDICGMNLNKLEGHQPGTPLPPLKEIYTSPDNPMYLHEGAGKDPKTGAELIPITKSPIYEASAVHNPEQTKVENAAKTKIAPGELYTCGMHPEVIQLGPGNCPICGMKLTPVHPAGSQTSGGERKIAYWHDPMDPNYISDKPGKSPMGMDLEPVYEDELGAGVIKIDPTTIQSIGVTTAMVELRDLTAELRTNGTVAVAENNEYIVNSRISGWIEKLYVSRTGDPVSAGDPLLEIYSPELVSAQDEYLLALKSANLLAGSGMQRNTTGAGDLLTAARRRLELWDINAAQIDELEKSGKARRTMTLYSPARGVVMLKNAVAGAAVEAGSDLFRIADLSTVWIIAQVYEYELPWVDRGLPVEVRSPYDPNLLLRGEVDYIYPAFDVDTRTAQIRIVVPNPRLDLHPDMYVDVRIGAQSRKNVVAVPKNAVLRSGSRDIVFVALGEGRFIPREVKLGLETDDYYEIMEGLTAGTEVVTSAQFLLDSEAKLQEAIQRRLQQRAKSQQTS